MSDRTTSPDEFRHGEHDRTTETVAVARDFAKINLIAGLLGFVGPAIWENDDRGLVNTDPGMFLGLVAVNGRHALLHVVYGALGLVLGRNRAGARGFMGLGGLFFGAMAIMGWRAFGFERGIHMMRGLAVDGWGNHAHAVFSGVGLFYALRPEPDETAERE